MSHSKNTGIGTIVKSLLITTFKLIAIVIAFTCKILGLVLTKTAELFEKLSSNGSH
ncbi:MAG: hypothetical protein JWQ38_344 [Flavipsychrobacter sp.]|nr:hypothetical protein [Flavipsychrobacter sp.]